jgi:hypothetical protein
MSEYLYTKNGVPIKVNNQQVFNPSGHQFGRVKGTKVHGPDGRYIGTIVGDRLIYRSADSATIGSPFIPSISSPSIRAHHAGSALSGYEPDIGD